VRHSMNEDLQGARGGRGESAGGERVLDRPLRGMRSEDDRGAPFAGGESTGWQGALKRIGRLPSRREALGLCVAASAGKAQVPGGAPGTRERNPASQAAGRAPSGSALLLGAPLFLKSDDPGALAREARRLGYSAAYCPPASPNDAARLRAIEAAFAKEGVVLAEVGVWVNLMDADPARRRENLRKVTEGLAVAEAVGARCAVTICGSFNEKVWYGPHPKNLGQEFFDAAVENARKIIDTVRPKRAKFTYEMMGWSLPDSPDAYVKMIRAVDRSAFAVHLDVCNLVNCPQRFYNNTALIEECFAKLGRWIVSCHAKDLDWVPEMNIHFVEVIPGRGHINYRAWLRGLASLPSPAPLMLEHLKTAEEYADGVAFIRRTASEMGLGFA